MDFIDGKPPSTNKFLSPSDQKMKYPSLLDQEYHNAKRSKVDVVEANLTQNWKNDRSPAKQEIRRQLEPMLYAINEAVYNHARIYRRPI